MKKVRIVFIVINGILTCIYLGLILYWWRMNPTLENFLWQVDYFNCVMMSHTLIVNLIWCSIELIVKEKKEKRKAQRFFLIFDAIFIILSLILLVYLVSLQAFVGTWGFIILPYLIPIVFLNAFYLIDSAMSKKEKLKGIKVSK